jgi:hypothetical protein
MKTLLTLITLATLTSAAFANPGHSGKKKSGKVAVHGEKAELIYEALATTDVETKDLKKFTAEVKTVGNLVCKKLTKKEDTAVVKFNCSLKGKKALRRGPGQRRGDHRRGTNHRRGGQGRGNTNRS